jgi:LuxR family maltose regulon positive regulatory protein
LTLLLLSTKFDVPPTGAKIVKRPRLLRKLETGLQQNALLILACGPAGYGKTTIVGEWLRTSGEIQPDQVTWLTLENGDNEPNRFLTYFITALQRIQPGFGAGVLKLLQSHKSTEAQSLAIMLVNELNEIPRRFALVLLSAHQVDPQTILNKVQGGFL